MDESMNSGEGPYVDRIMFASLRYVKQTRALHFTYYSGAAHGYNSVASLCSCASASQISSFNSICPFFSSSSSESLVASKGFQSEETRECIINYFREWFMSRKKPLFDQIFEILRTQEDATADLAFSRLNFQLNEAFVLAVLDYDKNDILSCLKFFDWAGRQSGFHHTTATFKSIFRIISKSKTDVMMEFLQNYEHMRYFHKVRYHNILVMGYAVAGKIETALQLLGKMRYRGMDLDQVSYHVLMNSLVDQGLYGMVETLAKHVKDRGFQNEWTHAIMIKNFCKQNDFERGEKYLQSLVKEGDFQFSGAVGTLVDALCKENQFERAAVLVQEFRNICSTSMQRTYGVWIGNLVKVGELDGALDFLKDKQEVDRYVPDIIRYNMLIYRLLKENRTAEVYDLLVDMEESHVLPDNITMNAILCFLCKVGMADIALHLYESRADFGLSVNFMAYNYLINALARDVKVEEAYRVLGSSIQHGFLPGDSTLSTLFDALQREGKLDKMIEIVRLAKSKEKNIRMSNLSYNRFISALCTHSKVPEAHLMHLWLNTPDKKPQKKTYMDLISGLSQSKSAHKAIELFFEMQRQGYRPTQSLVRKVISGIFETSNGEEQFFKLLEVQLSQCQTSFTYNAFIDGAGHAGQSDLALQVYLRMRRSGIKPRLRTNILLLRSFIKCGKIKRATDFFKYLLQKWRKKKLWVAMIVGLSKAKKQKTALRIVYHMMAYNIIPSVECFEELIKELCGHHLYWHAIHLLNNMTKNGRPISSFIGNTLLLHALRTKSVHCILADLDKQKMLTPICSKLGDAVGAFCGAIEEDYEEKIRELIRPIYNMDTCTINILLRRVGMSGVDRAVEYFHRLQDEGYKPNRWTYDAIIHGFLKEGRFEEAKVWMEKMHSKGFQLTEGTRNIYKANYSAPNFVDQNDGL